MQKKFQSNCKLMNDGFDKNQDIVNGATKGHGCCKYVAATLTPDRLRSCVALMIAFRQF